MDPTAILATTCLKMRQLGMFPSPNENADSTTLEGFLRGKKNGQYMVQDENFSISEDVVFPEEIEKKVHDFFAVQGFRVMADEDASGFFLAHKGEQKVSIFITPSSIASFVTIRDRSHF